MSLKSRSPWGKWPEGGFDKQLTFICSILKHTRIQEINVRLEISFWFVLEKKKTIRQISSSPWWCSSSWSSPWWWSLSWMIATTMVIIMIIPMMVAVMIIPTMEVVMIVTMMGVVMIVTTMVVVMIVIMTVTLMASEKAIGKKMCKMSPGLLLPNRPDKNSGQKGAKTKGNRRKISNLSLMSGFRNISTSMGTFNFVANNFVTADFLNSN